MHRLALFVSLATVLTGVAVFGQAPKAPPTTAQSINANFDSVNRRLLEMAKDFPSDKYEFKATPEVRSFREVIVHVFSGNAYAAKAGRGEQANWDEMDPQNYKNKAEVVSAFEKTINDSTAALKAVPAERLANAAAPWVARSAPRAQ